MTESRHETAYHTAGDVRKHEESADDMDLDELHVDVDTSPDASNSSEVFEYGGGGVLQRDSTWPAFSYFLNVEGILTKYGGELIIIS